LFSVFFAVVGKRPSGQRYEVRVPFYAANYMLERLVHRFWHTCCSEGTFLWNLSQCYCSVVFISWSKSVRLVWISV